MLMKKVGIIAGISTAVVCVVLVIVLPSVLWFSLHFKLLRNISILKISKAF